MKIAAITGNLERLLCLLAALTSCELAGCLAVCVGGGGSGGGEGRRGVVDGVCH